MKPLSPRAQRLTRAYRDQNVLPHDVRARLLARLAQPGPAEADVSRTQHALAQPPVARRWLRVLRWGGPAALLVVAIALLPRAPSLAPTAGGVEVVAGPGRSLPSPLPVGEGTEETGALPAGEGKEETGALPAAEGKENVRLVRAKRRRASAADTPIAVPSARREEPEAEEVVAAPTSVEAEQIAQPRDAAATVRPSAALQGRSGSGSTRVANQEAPVQEARPPAGLSLDDEVALVRRASDLLRAGDPMRALSALVEHARLFPAGKLVTMRQAARVQALCDLGRREQARSEAEIFLSDHGDSPYAAKVRQPCPVK